MKKLISLLKIYIIDSFNLSKYTKCDSLKTKLKMFGLAIFFVFISVSIFGTSFAYSFMISESLVLTNSLDQLLSIMMLASSIMILISTIYNVKGILFAFKDYDMQMALPIKTSIITTSRILIIYAINLFFSLIIMIPAMIVYAIRIPGGVDAYFYISFFFTFFLIPVIPTIVSTFLGLLIAIFSSRFRFANLINLIITFAFFLGIMFFSFSSQAVMTDFSSIAQSIMGMCDKVYPLVSTYTSAVCGGNILNLAIFSLLSIGLFIVFVLVVGKYFKKINTILLSSKIRSNYKMGSLKTSSPLMALYSKELKRYFTCTLYVFNTAFGMVIALIGAVALVFVSGDMISEIINAPGLSEIISFAAPLAISLLVVMSNTSCCSISLEGKNLWILKSLPVDTINIFYSKIAVNLVVTLPVAIILATVVSLKVPLDALAILFIFITPIIFSFFTSIFGLFLNLKMPNFGWQNEVQVIKQGIPPMIAVLGGMAVTATPFVLFYVQDVLSPVLILLLTNIIVAVITLLLWIYIKTKGIKIFNAF